LREDAAAGTGLRLCYRDRLWIVTPQPAQCVGQYRRAMAVAVAVLAEIDLGVVAGGFERGGPPPSLEGTAAGGVHEILPPGLHEDTNRPRLGAPDQPRQPIGASEVAEAADPRDHAAELIGTIPRRDEGADAARADTGDAVIVWIGGEPDASADLR